MKFKTLYDPVEKSFIHATWVFGEPQIFHSTTPQLLNFDVDKSGFAMTFGYSTYLDKYELVDVELTCNF